MYWNCDGARGLIVQTQLEESFSVMKSLALLGAATASFGLALATTLPSTATADETDNPMTFIEAPPSAMDRHLAGESRAAHARAQLEANAAIDGLAPGEFVWLDALAVNGHTEIVVDLSDQKAYVMKSGVLVGASTISSGKPGHETPTGTFEILQKRVEHYSNLYDDAPMPFMQRLTWDGIALHAGTIPGRPASRGCIRLPLDFAEALFAQTQIGTTVTVTA